MSSKKSDDEPKQVRVGNPVFAESGNVIVLGICMSIDSSVDFAKGRRTEEVEIHPLAVKNDGDDFFSPVPDADEREFRYELSEITPI